MTSADGTTPPIFPRSCPVRSGRAFFAYRGGALGALGQAAAAQRAFEDALAADPHSVEVRVIAGRLAIDRGDIEGARQLLAAAIRARRRTTEGQDSSREISPMLPGSMRRQSGFIERFWSPNPGTS